jgi:hypothetical protein
MVWMPSVGGLLEGVELVDMVPEVSSLRMNIADNTDLNYNPVNKSDIKPTHPKKSQRTRN